ncbi:MAG: RNA polymerase sigma factor FliA [Pseudomonadales bacterium]|nr:RNA polymerase sigma factor FliA [Pseudomonadales bacterium]MCP5184766.1 RNA polymerase sigma factor FliA [Pseudomonadales bacterium]
MRNPVAAYTATASDSQRIIQEHQPLVRRIAHRLMARLPDSVQVDDLLQAGMIGLLEAAAKYDGSMGASFETYAGIRIRGAMLDEVRRGDWVPRSVHRNARAISEATRRIEAETGREAHGTEVADAMGIDLEAFHRMLSDSRGARLFSLEELTDVDPDLVQAPSANEVEGLHLQHTFQRELAQAIDSLPEREKLVLSLYYDEELNLKEIGAVLGVSESRVCQIMGQATTRLRARVADWVDRDDE